MACIQEELNSNLTEVTIYHMWFFFIAMSISPDIMLKHSQNKPQMIHSTLVHSHHPQQTLKLIQRYKLCSQNNFVTWPKALIITRHQPPKPTTPPLSLHIPITSDLPRVKQHTIIKSLGHRGWSRKNRRSNRPSTVIYLCCQLVFIMAPSWQKTMQTTYMDKYAVQNTAALLRTCI